MRALARQLSSSARMGRSPIVTSLTAQVVSRSDRSLPPAGFRLQVLTHSIDLGEGRQRSAPVSIGDYAFVGTNSVLLPDSALPDYSVLGVKSLLERAFVDVYCLSAGVPARRVKDLARDSAYVTRTRGCVE